MAVKLKTGLRVNYSIIFLSGLVLLIAAFLVFLLIIKNIYGNYQIEQILPTKNNLTLLTDSKERKIAILYSKYTENMLPSGNTWLRDNIDAWEKYIKNAKFTYDVISDQSIELGDIFNYKTLALPGAKSLSDKEIVQLKKFIELGGSLFVTGGPATYSDDGKWRGWDFFTELFGMKFNTEIKPEETYKIHTIRGGLPITAGIPAGYALKIATWDRPIMAEVLEPRTTQASFWYDFRREAGLVREGISKSAGIAYGTYGRGRFVWFGFQITSVLGSQKDYVFFEKLFNNTLNWLTYNPTGTIKIWPEPYSAAAVVLPTLDEDIYSVNNIINAVSSKQFPVTFFVDPQTAIKNRSLIQNIARYGKIGAIVDLGFISSPEDTINQLYTKELQSTNIKFALDTLSKLSSSNVNAIMPYYGYYNNNTLQLISQYGIKFIVTDSLTDRSEPELKIMGDKKFLVITKTARDDYEIIGKYKLTQPEFQKYTYEEDVDRLLFEGGLYVLKLHTKYQLQPQFSGVVNDLLRYIRSKNIWVTSLDELLSWWEERKNIETRYETRSSRRIAVEITNPSDMAAENLVMEVHLNKKVTNVHVSAELINTKIPKYDLSDDQQTIYFYVDKMEPHETRTLLVDFDNVSI
ncbi:hypothetical protein ABRY23_01360 [Melioribacteraceae bacterium 4301-Me]|uniref:hypothetical protein n=1 Tax=Pyranulibacter aquaticus TaxID=3163344 RepID=UPI00359BC4A1